MDFSPGRLVAYRVGRVGWVKTTVGERLSATEYNLAIRGKATSGNVFLRKPDGVDLDPNGGPVRYAPWAPTGATPKAHPPKTRTKSRTDQLIIVPESSSSSSDPKSFGPDQLRQP
eukprot:9140389-Pyramimonas_sp.AAC.1